MEKIINYINGKLVESNSSKFLNVEDPSIGKNFIKLSDSNIDDLSLAVKSAKNSFHIWSSLAIEDRSKYLHDIANYIQDNIDDFADAESLDTGKPISLAKNLDIPRAISNFRFFADYAKNFEFNFSLNNDNSTNLINQYPLGVVGCISPWNLPLYLFSWKIAPALIAGNTVIAKPSEITPLTAYMLSKACIEVNLPDGVLNIIHGRGSNIGNLIINHPDIKAISFTGGTETGKKIAQETAGTFKKLSLEMGGKNASIIFNDSDYDKMLDTTIRSSFSNQGQICLCTSRLLIESSIYEKFKKDLIARTKNLIIGDPKKRETEFGAISSKQHFEKIMTYIKMAKQQGGKIIAGGNPILLNGRCKDGYFIEPTIIESLDNDSIINQDEIFGPVITLQKFNSEKDAILLANNSNYGLSATVWSNDDKQANRIASKIDAGVIWINCWLVRDLRTPFGGVKQSGLGREGGSYALDFFTETKNICRSLT